MVVISICESDLTYKSQFLKKGITKIKDFPKLHSILGTFTEFSKENYDCNIFLNMANWASVNKNQISDTQCLIKKFYEINKIQQAKECEIILSEIENLLNSTLDLNKLPKKKRNAIISKMKSFDRGTNQSVSIFRELYLFVQLTKNKNIYDIIYDNSPKSNHDFSFKIDTIEFNIEVAGLGPSLVDRIILESFRSVAEKIITEIPNNMSLFLEINVKRLKNNEDKFNKQYIVEFLTKSIQTILPILQTPNTSISFDTFNNGFINKFQSLFDLFEYLKKLKQSLIKDKINLGPEMDLIDIFKTIIQNKGKQYLLKTSTEVITSTPIASYYNIQSRKRCLQISTRNIYPSRPEEERIEAKFNQFKRVLESKLDKNQLKNQPNPIIVIQFTDYYFHNYSKDSFLNFELIMRLKDIIKKCFVNAKDKNKHNILGIIVYEKNLNEGIFFQNPIIHIPNEIKQKIELIVNKVI